MLSEEDMLSNDELTEFLKAKEKSVSARLLIQNPEITKLYLGTENGCYASIAYLAWKRGQLNELDSLINKWQIESRGTTDFKNRLNENWLNDCNKREARNNPLSALSELMAASYLSGNGFTVTNLSAWNKKCKADIECKNSDGVSSFFEVKFLPDSPEFEKLRVDVIKSCTSSARAMPQPLETRNYYFSRFAEAVIQMRKTTERTEERNVFFVFSEQAAGMSGRGLFEEAIEQRYDEWEKDDKGEYLGVSEKKLLEEILSQNRKFWLNEAGNLYMATMKDFKLHKISRYARNDSSG